MAMMGAPVRVIGVRYLRITALKHGLHCRRQGLMIEITVIAGVEGAMPDRSKCGWDAAT